jgi:ubiquinone/menaquinone biosynthesis C-methylase UbiE
MRTRRSTKFSTGLRDAAMSFYGDQVLPRLTNVLLGNSEFSRIRGRVAAGLEGDVLEVGFGSGLNVPHYPPAVRRVRALDPAVVGRKLAAKRMAASTVPVEFVEIQGDAIPLPSESVDHVLITWTMCTIPNIEHSLGEMRRVLRGGGTMRFVEHGRSPEAEVARWQDRLTPLQRLWAGGCHLNRPIDQLVAGAGFEMTRLENYYMKGPRAYGYMFEGVATRA